ncbi:MAG: hypothetical protein BMS9Abin02_1474 [Anaerolineae bacterium]|nr:MAG: hypothetical protein BMS9Abin02_1474 [Anaerolineae bacterium]
MSGNANWFPEVEWYEGYHLSAEAYQGQEDFIDANLFAGYCNFHLGPGLSVTLVASTEESVDIEGASAHKRQKENEDIELISNLYPVLGDIVQWHIDGTRYNIKLDPIDGLIYAGQPGVQLTWMDAKIGDWIVTPRVGKPIEVSALWYNALHIMVELSDHLGKNPSKYVNLAEQTRNGFIRYWHNESGYCYDLLDGPDGHDHSLRPNQLLAVSLPYSPLTADQQKSIVDICSQRLATSFGLRSLAKEHRDYISAYGGDQEMRDGSYHQGTVWGWLMGPYLSAHLRVYNDKGFVNSALEPFFHHLAQHGVGSISEIFDGDPPHTPRGCPAQAWSVAEALRVWGQINKGSEKDPPRKNSHDPANH